MTDFKLPETRYAQSGEVSIAYQVMGDGPIDLILVSGFVSHIEFAHELTGFTAFLRRLASFARVVTFDKRGQGLSDRMSGAPSLEVRMDDVRDHGCDRLEARCPGRVLRRRLHEHPFRRDVPRARIASHSDRLLQLLRRSVLG